jgi:hypothetical protein
MDELNPNYQDHASGDGYSEGPHLLADLLTRLVDGELATREAAQAQAHLDVCWSCRTRRDHLEECVSDLVDFRNCLLKKYPAPSKSTRNVFMAALDGFLEELGKPPLIVRLLGVLKSTMVRSRHLVWSTAALALAVALLVFFKLEVVATVSASELLEKARFAEKAASNGARTPIVYQRVRISSGKYSLTRTLYRDPIGNRVSASVQADHYPVAGDALGEQIVSAEAERELRRIFQTARLDWNNPLSPRLFGHWHDALFERDDAVRSRGQDVILKTRAEYGSIREGELAVRKADFHVVGEKFLLQDEQHLDVSELSYEFLNLDQIDLAIFSPPALAPIAPRPVSKPAPPAPAPILPTEAQLTQSELEARVALHAAEADLGEPLEISRGEHSVVIRGLASSPERKEELLAVLRDIPFAEAQLQPIPKSEEFSPGVPSVVVVDGHPALEDALQKQFPNSEQRAAFVNRALAISQEATAHAWALHRLEESYTPARIALLSGPSRRILELLIRDHVDALHRNVDAEIDLIGLLPPLRFHSLDSLSDSPAAMAVSLSASRTNAGTGGIGSEDWRSGVTRTFPSLEKLHEDVVVLLSGSNAQSVDAGALKANLEEILGHLKGTLPGLDREVTGTFLGTNPNFKKE